MILNNSTCGFGGRHDEMATVDCRGHFLQRACFLLETVVARWQDRVGLSVGLERHFREFVTFVYFCQGYKRLFLVATSHRSKSRMKIAEPMCVTAIVEFFVVVGTHDDSLNVGFRIPRNSFIIMTIETAISDSYSNRSVSRL